MFSVKSVQDMREWEEFFCIKNFVWNKTLLEKQVGKKATWLVGKCKFFRLISSVFSKEEEKKRWRTEHNCLANVHNKGGRIRSNTHPFVHFQNLKTPPTPPRPWCTIKIYWHHYVHTNLQSYQDVDMEDNDSHKELSCPQLLDVVWTESDPIQVSNLSPVSFISSHQVHNKWNWQNQKQICHPSHLGKNLKKYLNKTPKPVTFFQVIRYCEHSTPWNST
jgi:hypothetical protein